jgi:hypothetical protein
LAPIWDKESTPVRDAHWSGPGEKELRELLIAPQHALVQELSIAFQHALVQELLIALQHALVRMRSNWDDSDRGTS